MMIWLSLTTTHGPSVSTGLMMRITSVKASACRRSPSHFARQLYTKMMSQTIKLATAGISRTWSASINGSKWHLKRGMQTTFVTTDPRQHIDIRLSRIRSWISYPSRNVFQGNRSFYHRHLHRLIFKHLIHFENPWSNSDRIGLKHVLKIVISD